MSRTTVRRRVDSLLDSRRSNVGWQRAFVFSAVLVAFAIGIILSRNGIAATHEEQVLDCQVAGVVAHTHDASCYDVRGNLVCELPEVEPHEHDDSCYAEVPHLICGQEESEDHQHTDECYEMVRELTCRKEEVSEVHVHGPGCFKTVTVEDGAETGNAITVTSRTTEDGGQEFVGSLKKQDEEEELVLGFSVKVPEGALPEGTTLRVEEIDPSAIEEPVTAAATAANEDVTSLAWLRAVDIRFIGPNGAKVEPEFKPAIRLTHDRIRDVAEPVLARVQDDNAELVSEFARVSEPEEDENAESENSLKFEAATLAIFAVAEAEYREGREPGTPAAEAETGETTLTGTAGGVTVTATAPEEALPEGADIVVTALVDASEHKSQVEDMLTSDDTRVRGMAVVKVGFVDAEGEAVEPDGEMNVTLASETLAGAESSALVRLGEEAEVVAEGADEANALSFEGNAAGTFALVGTETIVTQAITASGEAYDISVTYGPEADIPEGAELQATEITPESDKFDGYLAEAAEVLDAESLSYARFFDVSIVVDGREVEPAAPVQVEIHSQDGGRADDASSLQVVHFADTGTEVIEPAVEANDDTTTVTYLQSGFSVIGLVAPTNPTTGWPTSTGQYAMVLQDGRNFYAVAHDGTLTRVRHFENTIAFMGPGTDSLSYVDDYRWYFTTQGQNATRWAITSEYYSGSGSPSPSTIAVDFASPTCFSTGTGRFLQMRDGKVFSNGQNPSGGYSSYTFSADGGTLSRVDLYDEEASTILFVPFDSFEADDNTTEYYELIDVNAMIDLWKKRMTKGMEVDKTAEVYDYDNRIYQVDIEASSGLYDINPDLYLEYVVDASRSMYFPATLEQAGTYNGGNGLINWLNSADTSQVYYVITDQGDDTRGGSANVYAVYYLNGKWRFADASYYHTEDNTRIGDAGGTYGIVSNGTAQNPDDYYRDGVIGRNGDTVGPSNVSVLNNQGLSGVIYTSPPKIQGQPWNRLDYLRASVIASIEILFAVNPDAKIGLTSFNAEAEHTGPYTAQDKQVLIDKVNDIGVIGGTNHAAGLEAAYNIYSAIPEQDRDHKQSVVFVTDGAPKVGSTSAATLWGYTETQANRIKSLKDKFGKNTDLYTLGLSLQYVGNYNLRRLAGISSGEGYHYNSEDGAQVVDCITQIIESVAAKADILGDATDVIDPAFYPVDADGNNIESGSWINLNGEVVAADSSDAVGLVTYDGDAGTWSVTWADQIFPWATILDDHDATSIPGWHSRIYVKAKEDFLGGNGISTNIEEGSEIDAKQFHRLNTDTWVEYPADEVDSVKPLATPYVNVDELALTSHQTEWTVYLGTEVDPLEEIRKLWDNVMVKEVVSDSGTDGRRTGSMTYALAQQSVEDGRAETADRKEVVLNTLPNMTLGYYNWSNLKERGWIEKSYSAYGHTNVGTLRVELAKTVAAGEQGLTDAAHPTEVVGNAVERYTLTVTYTPADAAISDYHTGDYGTERPGNDTDPIVRERQDTHVINVFAKKLQLLKVDTATGNPITADTAEFTLYVVDDEEGEAVEGLPTAHAYRAVTDLVTDATGWTDETDYLPDGSYWLVETKAPTGYIPAEPIALTVAITEDATATQAVLVDAAGAPLYDKPIGWNWTQQATLNIANTSDAVLHGAQPGAANQPDSETATIQYDIKNTNGVELPKAGGSGLRDIYATGIAMMVGAATYLVFRRRGEEE